MSMIFIWALLLIGMNTGYSQDAVTELYQNTSVRNSEELVTEKILKVSLSRKIFIISNQNAGLGAGDFFTILLNNDFVARALVAKSLQSNQAAIKITQVYAAQGLPYLQKNREIQIIRGDDSFYRKEKKEVGREEENKEIAVIKTEDDLYNDTSILEENALDLDENKNRAIKNDNIASLSLGFIEGLTSVNGIKRYSQFNGSWSYQISDNFWVELAYGQHVAQDFPAEGLGTKVSNLMFKAKYAFAGPLFTFFMPYMGFQIISAESPGAGVSDVASPTQEQINQLEQEVDLVSDTEKKRLIFGITALRRLVPGWFLRGDFGNDLIGVGFGLEF